MIFGVLTRVIPIPARSGDRLPRHPACSVFEVQNEFAGTLLNILAHSLYFRCYAAAFSQASGWHGFLRVSAGPARMHEISRR